MERVMLAHNYQGSDPRGWLMSEKLDGVRAIFDGAEFISRNGNILFAPDSFKRKLPDDLVLDGELYIGRGKFEQVVSAVRKKNPIGREWDAVHYKVFDVQTEGTYLDRIKLVPPSVEVIEQIPCEGVEHLRAFHDSLVMQGAEGAMLRNPTAEYELRRSRSLLKVKIPTDDTAEVVNYQEGTGRLHGLVGALVCRWRGHNIVIGSGLDDAERRQPPPIGSTVRFNYFGLTAYGEPRHPVYLGKEVIL